jgi:hypothetical protein
VVAQDREEAVVARFDQRARDLQPFRDDATEPLDPALREGVPELLDRLVRRGEPPQGQDPRRIGDTLLRPPAVVEHHLGDPLVRVVLDERVQERDRRIVRKYGLLRMERFEIAELEGRVARAAVIVDAFREVDAGKQRQGWCGQPGGVGTGHARVQEAIRDAAVSRDRKHLAGVRRADAAGDQDGS